MKKSSKFDNDIPDGETFSPDSPSADDSRAELEYIEALLDLVDLNIDP